MKALLTLSFALLFSAHTNTFAEESYPAIQEPQKPSIHWYPSLKAAEEANSTLPYYISFTGMDWCFWCQLLEKDIQSQPDFINKVYDKFTFVRIDIPRDASATDATIREFMLQHKVYGVPVILILSSDKRELGRLSYQKISPTEFADLALGMR